MYVMLIWLPQHGFHQPEAASKKLVYIPEREFSKPSYCYCGLLEASQDNTCFFVNTHSKIIHQRVKDGQLTPELL